MAQQVPSNNPPIDKGEKRRVKVYELRHNDWFDKGTGFCTAAFIFNEISRQEEPRVFVQSEDDPSRMILETRVCKDEGFTKQTDTLIVWTEPTTSSDMALSFQESDGCAAIWKFVHNVQQQLNTLGGTVLLSDDACSDDMPMDPFPSSPECMPNPSLGALPDIESQIRNLTNTGHGREALTKYVLAEDYIQKLIPLVEMAEDLGDLPSLHKLCNIMKTFILLNDTTVMELVVADDLILGVVGALEYDPDFPSHKANHRHWLGKEGRFKEVVRIEDKSICKKIHATYRLQYLKDVVLARILDDPTFSVLNSLIFFNQVDIVQHLQNNSEFLKELFGIFDELETDQKRKKEAVLFIQQCCAIAKNLQPNARAQLYNNFIDHDLLSVINYALRHNDVSVRVGATDVLVSIIDHDPQMIRQTVFRQISGKEIPLTDSLIDLLLVEADLGIKSQIADAIKVVLEVSNPTVPLDKGHGDYSGRMRPQPDPQHAEFIKDFYEDSAKRLFMPLIDLKERDNLDFSAQQVSLFIYLIEILCYFVRQHTHHSKYFVLSENLGHRIAQLLKSSEKYLRLSALKFFRNLVGLQDEFYNQQMAQGKLFEPILDLILDTMPRDTLLNSAALELFSFIGDKKINNLNSHLVENYREKLARITYVDTFAYLISRYDSTQGFTMNMHAPLTDHEDEASKRAAQSRGSTGRWESGIKDLDAQEEEYFNKSDDEDETATNQSSARESASNCSPSKPLVDYPSDEEGEDSVDHSCGADENTPPSSTPNELEKFPLVSTVRSPVSPPEKVSEKRRREADEADEMDKLSQPSKRRSSTSSVGSNGVLRRKRAFPANAGVNGSKSKIAISISPAIKKTEILEKSDTASVLNTSISTAEDGGA